ncbi:putative arabinose efflux permease, MFS family [Streptoalloteichus tenebrarius]|uniref:Arabinose efflux permease, MFS family n=1 Tax=Streptoalloteichus tenebrarius (strain ATCC 17920 / DSM 40477 / JCM 4838 / CBS 697.72 / NBRC 16177 / NCIMB 11028 / NRRL B-12390 / A12253. 1 / ISP 5477) TaxID=1933 RepID=A0ABT1HU26_STRSD|nr:MFS transporter [Streptoalloteichus tenebrarius]MCP2259033.1 putative arabinose efflux permease, MFS family [Streptoalloteichus tenebrarius]BFE99642.1 MFS transporter [Streptoalloteichus tenebrarius]
MPPPSRLLANRDFRLLWLAASTTAVGSLAAAVALPLLVLATGGSAAEAGLVGCCVLAAAAAAALPGGRLTDRHDRRTVITVCACGSAVATGLLALAVRADEHSLPLVLLTAGVDAALRATLGAAEMAALPRLVPGPSLPRALSAHHARLAGAALAGPPLGGALFELAPALPFAVAAAGSLVAALCVLAIDTPLPAPHREEGSGLFAGLAFLWRDGFLRQTTLVHAAQNAVFSAVPLVVVAVGVRHHTSGLSIGLVYATVGAGALLGSALATGVGHVLSPWSAVLATCWVPATLLALSASAPVLTVLAAALTVSSGVSPVAGAVLGSLRLLRTPDALRGRAQAAAALVGTAATPLGPPAAGLLLDRAGPAAALLALAAGLAALAVVVTSSSRLRRLPPLLPTRQADPDGEHGEPGA